MRAKIYFTESFSVQPKRFADYFNADPGRHPRYALVHLCTNGVHIQRGDFYISGTRERFDMDGDSCYDYEEKRSQYLHTAVSCDGTCQRTVRIPRGTLDPTQEMESFVNAPARLYQVSHQPGEATVEFKHFCTGEYHICTTRLIWSTKVHSPDRCRGECASELRLPGSAQRIVESFLAAQR